MKKFEEIVRRTERRFRIVSGFHDMTPCPDVEGLNKFNHRTAFILDTYRSDSDDMVFDVELFIELVAVVSVMLQLDRIIVHLGDDCTKSMSFESWSKLAIESGGGEFEPFHRAECCRAGDLQAVLNVENWAAVGGPEPYSDSYTLSVFTKEDNFEELVVCADEVSKKLNATIAAILKGSPTRKNKKKRFFWG